LERGIEKRSFDDVATAERRALREVWAQWQATLAATRAKPNAERIHRLRIATKRLRYRMELAEELGDGRQRRQKRVLAEPKALQQALGKWNDRRISGRLVTRCTRRVKFGSAHATPVQALLERAGELKAVG